MKMEDRILGVAAFACYLFALTASGVVTYALITLWKAAYGGLGRGVYLAASQF
ncbi:MAG TPA: hypothetical protein VF654_11495 [Pyrinomonadaceae bacterium]|jgi:hypothetical protein